MLYIGRECACFNADIFINGDKIEHATSSDNLGYKLFTVGKQWYG